MNAILLYDRVWQKLKRTYRAAVFRAKTGCQANLVGDITLINANLRLGKHVTIYPDVMFFGDGLIEIGDNVDIGNGTIIYASRKGGVKIGANTVIAAQCYIIDMDHGMKKGQLVCKQENTVAPVVIGEDVWLGANVTVLKGTVIGAGAVIGAKALVKGKIESNASDMGIPAHVVKYRLHEGREVPQ